LEGLLTSLWTPTEKNKLNDTKAAGTGTHPEVKDIIERHVLADKLL
jgi:hypothetical protein